MLIITKTSVIHFFCVDYINLIQSKDKVKNNSSGIFIDKKITLMMKHMF